ncbi:MAG: CsrR [Devosia sp.]|nr:CsrR [Devosia sp.]
MLPYVDGMEVCRVIREESLPARVLMLAANDSMQDKIEGLKGGADDYLTKPFAFDELLARIVALRRRGGGHEQTKLLNVGDNETWRWL